MKKSNVNQLRLINKAYEALVYITKERDMLYNEIREEEKGHRKFMGNAGEFKLSIDNSAKLHVVRGIAQFLTHQRKVEIIDYLHTNKSLFTAAAIVENYRDKCEAAFKPFDVNELANLDYLGMNGLKL